MRNRRTESIFGGWNAAQSQLFAGIPGNFYRFQRNMAEGVLGEAVLQRELICAFAKTQVPSFSGVV